MSAFIAEEDTSLVDAMRRINDNSRCVLYIVDGNGRLIGSLTDGDIRKWIVETGNLKAKVSDILNRDVIFITEGDNVEPNSVMMLNHISSLPLVDSKRNIIDIYFLGENIDGKQIRNTFLADTPIIIMAGGQGTRLRPYTKILPKPLIPIKGIPIIERIMNQFNWYGARDFYVTINYRKEMIKSYFSYGSFPYNIHFFEENRPLGTAGSIQLIKVDFTNPVIITNCDTLIQWDYKDIIDKHEKKGNDITVVSADRHTVIPYGVLYTESSDDVIASMEEKPEINYSVNTGMYVVNPDILKWIPKNQTFHMTDLLKKLMEKKKRVGIYKIKEEAFLDMGEFEEMKKMEEYIQTYG